MRVPQGLERGSLRDLLLAGTRGSLDSRMIQAIKESRAWIQLKFKAVSVIINGISLPMMHHRE